MSLGPRAERAMGVRGYALMVWRCLAAIIVGAVIGGLLAFAACSLITPVYQSTARIVVTSALPDQGETPTGARVSRLRVEKYAALAESELVAARVKERLSLSESARDLADDIEGVVITSTQILELKVSSDDPDQARNINEAYVEELALEVESIEASVADQPRVTLTVIDPPTLPDELQSPRTLRNVIVAAVLGAQVGLTIGLVRLLLDSSVRTRADVAAVTDVPVLASTPLRARSRRASGDLPEADDVELRQVDAVRTSLDFLALDAPTPVVLVTSPGAGEGKTTLAVELARSLARSGASIVLVDADLRRPQVADRLELDESTGLTSVLLGRTDLAGAVQSAGAGLDVLTAGVLPPNPSELLQTRAMARLLAELQRAYAVVVVDGPPVLAVADAAELAAVADVTLLAVRHGATGEDAVEETVERLRRAQARIGGIVLTMVPRAALAAELASPDVASRL